METKRHDDGIGRQDVLAACDRFRFATTCRIRFSKRGFDHFHASHLALGIHFNSQRLQVKHKFNAFFFGVFHFTA
ncbi:Uncharacterised protein [Vibrio cholerae]|nr:Uncharacterised protein [Vibrio cholerae]